MPYSSNKKIHITPSGVSICRVNQNHLHVDFKNIQSVGLENIVDVEHHLINTVFNSRSHLIKFRNGGEVTFVYNDKGQLVDMCAIGVNLFFSQNNELIFSIRPINA
jgi:hypothetical protein